MKLLDQLPEIFRARSLNRSRIIAALVVAIIADGLQLLLGPLGWVGVDQAIDLVAMVLCIWVLGFHVLLLPTFVVKLIPVIDELPTWTACVIAVIALRKREGTPPPPAPPAPPAKPVIDV